MLEFIGAVAGADGDSEGIQPGPFAEFRRLPGIGKKFFNIFFILGRIQAHHILLNPPQHAQFRLHHHARRMGHLDGFGGEMNIFLKRMMAAVDHHAGITITDAGFDQFDGVAVIAVDTDRQVGIFLNGRVNNRLEKADIGIFSGALGYLKNTGAAFLGAGLHDGLREFHIVDVKRPNCEPTVIGEIKHRFAGHQRHHSTPLKSAYHFLKAGTSRLSCPWEAYPSRPE